MNQISLVRKASRIAVCLGVLLGFALVPSAVWAQCTTFAYAPPDGRIIEEFIGAGGDEGFFFIGPPGRSYSVEVMTEDDTSPTIFFGNAGVSCPTSTGGIYRVTSAIVPLVITSRGSRASFTAVTGGTPFYAVRVQSGTTATYRYSVSDTTQYHPGWSTGGGFNTFYSILNTTNDSCTVTLTLFNLAGAQVATATQAIAAGALLATNTSALGVAAGLAGTGRLTHNCPPGAIFVDAAIANFGGMPPSIIPAKFAPVRE